MTATLPFKPKDADKLQNIPGLYLHGIHATGSIDALAAGKYVLTGKLPEVPEVRALPALPKAASGARNYQKLGISWLISTLQQHGGAILSDEMGLGKTFQTISTLRASSIGRTLILCPGSVRETWRDELHKWHPEAQTAVLYPGGGKEWEAAATAKYVVCSHDYRMIDRAMTLAFSGEYPEFLVIDEAHRFRGRKSRRSDVMEMVGALIPYKIALTGTPQWNTMKDWWQLLRIILPGRFGSQWDFDRRYAGAKAGQYGGLEYPRKDDAAVTPKLLNTAELKMRLNHYMLGRTKQEVAKDLPPMTVAIRWVDSTPEAKRALQKMQLGTKSAGSPVHDAIIATLKGKVEEVLALAAEAQRFVLTTWTNQGAADLHRLLNQQGTPCILATASQSGPKRAEAIREAIRRRCGLVATTDLFAEGLNLQHVASVGILHALDFVPQKMQQLMGRLHRIDIVDPVTWHIVAMRDSVDKYIIDAGVFKLDAITATMGKKTQLRAALKNDKQDAVTERAALASLYSVMEADHGEEINTSKD